MFQKWSNLAKVVYKRTYSRSDNGTKETWTETVDRVLNGNFRMVADNVGNRMEKDELRDVMLARKGGPAGRGLWFSGAPSHSRIGGVALCNCWYVNSSEWTNFVIAMDLLMLGGGVGLSVEHRFVSKLPRVKKDVVVTHVNTKDADFIVPDSRQGWLELYRRILESYFVSGKSFSYSTVCIRGYGEPILGFGGTASGAGPLIKFVENLNFILGSRAGKAIRPVDAMDLICATGELVVSGNVRRSAIIIMGDGHDKDYLRSKRWDLGPVPTYRATANLSVICDDTEDLHPLFWKTYENGEPFGIINRTNIQQFARMGEYKVDTAEGMNPSVTGDTEILTDDGYKSIESLVEKTVNVWNGFEWSKVRPKVTGKNQNILSITFSDGRNLKCTPYHKFHISKDYSDNNVIVEAKDLKPGMKLIKHEFPVIEHGQSLKHAYTQGFVAAEGMELNRTLSVYKPKEMCMSRLEGIKKSTWSENSQRHNVTLIETPVSKNFVPLEYNLKSKIEWLAGLFDGDGTELKEGGLQLVSVNREFIRQLQKLLSTLGVQSKVLLGNLAKARPMPDGRGGTKMYDCQESYRICIGATQMQSLKKLGLKCERMSFDKAPQRDASQFITITNIIEHGTVDKVYCFNEPKRHMGIFAGVLTGQCAEATLENYEPCNLQEIALGNIEDPNEFVRVAKLLHRYGKRVTLEPFHIPEAQKVISRNRRVGTGITGCLERPDLFNPEVLDLAYKAIQQENVEYAKTLNIPESIRTTVIKPSGTMSKLMDQKGEGLHAAYSRHMIQRIRFGSNDPLLPLLKAAGHYMEPVVRFDGTLDPNTMVVDFYLEAPESMPCADEGFDTWRQLDTLLMAQKYWADQAVSVTVYYRKEDLPEIKSWLANNLKYLKSISFLCHSDHGFKQAPKESITEEQYNKLSSKVKPLEEDEITGGDLEQDDCAGGYCPIK